MKLSSFIKHVNKYLIAFDSVINDKLSLTNQYPLLTPVTIHSIVKGSFGFIIVQVSIIFSQTILELSFTLSNTF